jgi:hypothetical protein
VAYASSSSKLDAGRARQTALNAFSSAGYTDKGKDFNEEAARGNDVRIRSDGLAIM